MHVITVNNMPHFKQPDEFNFTQPAEWPTWSRRFQRFRLAEKLHKEDGDVQVSSLLYAMGQESETIMITFALTEVEQNNFYTVMSKFNFYFRPKVNYIEYRVAFQQRGAKHEESIEQFTRALYEIAENCNYGEQKHENIRDRIIWCRDKRLPRSGNELTLDDAVTTVRQYEQVKSQLNVKQSADVDEVTSRFRNMSHKSNRAKNKTVKKTAVVPQPCQDVTGVDRFMQQPVVDVVDVVDRTNQTTCVLLVTENAENWTKSDISNKCAGQET